jgi:hypothetical protein
LGTQGGRKREWEGFLVDIHAKGGSKGGREEERERGREEKRMGRSFG